MGQPFNFAVPRSTFKSNGKTRVRPCLKKGSMNRRIIVDETIDGVEYRYHATKGWRIKTDDPAVKRKAEWERSLKDQAPTAPQG